MVLLTFAVVCSIASTTYVHIFLDHLEESVGMPENIDMAIGVILILLVIESTRQAWGLTLPIVGTVFILYFFLGHLIPGPLYHREFDFSYVISYLCTGLTGVYGTFMSISANQIFLFVVFGALLAGVKVNDCLNEIGKYAGRFSQAGPAYTAVISSSLVGMVLRIVILFSLLASISSAIPMLWEFTIPSGKIWLWLVAIGGLGTLGQLSLAHAYKLAPASQVSPLGYSGLLFAGLIGLSLWSEAPDFWTIAGTIFIVIAGIFVAREKIEPAPISSSFTSNLPLT